MACTQKLLTILNMMVKSGTPWCTVRSHPIYFSRQLRALISQISSSSCTIQDLTSLLTSRKNSFKSSRSCCAYRFLFILGSGMSIDFQARSIAQKCVYFTHHHHPVSIEASSLIITPEPIPSWWNTLDGRRRRSNPSRERPRKAGVPKRGEDDRHMADLGPRQHHHLRFRTQRLE